MGLTGLHCPHRERLFYWFNWGDSSVLGLHWLQLSVRVCWLTSAWRGPPQQAWEPMGARHPTEAVQRKGAIFEVHKALEEQGRGSRALLLFPGSITPAVPREGEELPPGAAGGPGDCPVALKVVRDVLPSLPAPIAGLSPGTQWLGGCR